MKILTDPVFGDFLLRKTKTRGMKLAFTNNGFIEVRMSRPSKQKALAYISDNKSWLSKHYRPVYIHANSYIADYKVVVKTCNKISVRTSRSKKTIRLCLPAHEEINSLHIQELLYRRSTKIFRDAVARQVTNKAQIIARRIDKAPHEVKVRAMHSRWGSCTSKKVVSISCFAFYLGDDLFDYLVIHELSHLTHLDHSSKFWSEVEKWSPNYMTLKGRLSANKLQLRPH